MEDGEPVHDEAEDDASAAGEPDGEAGEAPGDDEPITGEPDREPGDDQAGDDQAARAKPPTPDGILRGPLSW